MVTGHLDSRVTDVLDFTKDAPGADDDGSGVAVVLELARLFVEGIPTAVTPAQIAVMQSVGGENDGATHQLARFVTDVAPFDLTGMNVRVIWRRDRYLRGRYEVMLRETTAPDWTSAISVGNVTTVTLDMAKDNVQFGLRAVDQAGHRSPAALPQVVTT